MPNVFQLLTVWHLFIPCKEKFPRKLQTTFTFNAQEGSHCSSYLLLPAPSILPCVWSRKMRPHNWILLRSVITVATLHGKLDLLPSCWRCTKEYINAWWFRLFYCCWSFLCLLGDTPLAPAPGLLFNFCQQFDNFQSGSRAGDERVTEHHLQFNPLQYRRQYSTILYNTEQYWQYRTINKYIVWYCKHIVQYCNIVIPTTIFKSNIVRYCTQIVHYCKQYLTILLAIPCYNFLLNYCLFYCSILFNIVQYWFILLLKYNTNQY